MQGVNFASRQGCPIGPAHAISSVMDFASAYRQLQPAEKDFTDSFVSELETRAVRTQSRLHDLLAGPLPQHELLERPLVRAAISERIKDLQDAADLSAYRVLKEMQSIAFSNIADYFEFDQQAVFFNFAKCTREQMAAVQSVEMEFHPGGIVPKKVKFKLHDKVAGLDRFMRHMGLLDADNEYQRRNTPGVIQHQPLGLPVTVSDAQAADAYSRLIND